MKIMQYIIFLLLLTTNVFAQKIAEQGQEISSDKFNSSVSQVGEIKQSILTLEQFQTLNGNCWRLMDGSSLSGTDLANITAMANLPDARGAFLRMANNGRSDGQQNPEEKSLGEEQADKAYGLASFSINNGSSSAANDGLFPQSGAVQSPNMNTGRGSSGNYQRTSFTFNGSETRPKNITVNFFIKVNKSCSF